MSDPISVKRRKKIQEYLQIIKAVSASTDDYLYLTEYDTGRAYFTNNIHEKYQLPPCGEDGIKLEDWVKTIYPRDVGPVLADLQRVFDGTQTTHNVEYRLLDRKGNRCWISCRGTMIQDDDGQPLLLLGRVSDTVLGQKTDILTGFFNGRKYAEDITASLNRGQSGCLLILGLDNFKDINIKYGRAYGNHLLKQFAELLEEHVAAIYPAYRLDGDRFALNLYGQNEEGTRQIYEHIRQSVTFGTLSGGAVLYSAGSSSDGETLFQYAESALDRAKKDGKNRLFFFSIDDYKQHQNSLELLAEMRHSIQHDFEGFFLCYQPQMQCQGCRICGVEALLRFHSAARGGIVSPAEFIPLLEQSRLIVPVGEWVLRTALAACRKWRLSLPCLRISVNLSYIQLLEENITSTILDILKESGLPGDALTLELTESVQLQNYEYYNRIFYRWEIAGIRIAIDDFGTGYSSLGYLKSLCLDEIKIDRCFVSGIQHSSYNYRLMRNTIELARGSQIHVCCEGVETEDELTILKELLPDTLQGYLFAPPCTSDIFEQLYIDSDSKSFRNRLQLEERFRAIGTSKKENAHPIFHKKLDFETNLTECAHQFAEEADTKTALEHLLLSIAEFYNADCAYIYEPIRDETNWYCSAVCCLKNTAASEVPQTLSAAVIDRWITYFSLGESVIIETPGDILSGSPLELDLLHSQNITGLIAVPIGWCGQTIGFIGVTNPLEHPANDGMLFVAACFVADRLKQSASPNRVCAVPGLTAADVLSRTQLGLWALRIYADPQQNEMFADDAMLRTLGLSESQTPQQCYRHWHSRISENYRHYVDTAIRCMEETGRIVQVEYTWEHPHLGEVIVRFLGLRTKDHTGTVSLCGYHRVISNIERPVLPDADNGQAHIFELESARKTDFYEAMLSETIAYTELDLETGRPLTAGGLWEHYEEDCRQWSESFQQAASRYIPRVVAPEYHDICRSYFDQSTIHDMHGATRKFCYRRMVGSDFHWVELSIHVFCERFTGHHYALLYLKDIDTDKKRELAQVSAANTDPLTKVYNRRMFQDEVESFMESTDKPSCGALILFDIDDFKQINDQYGHPQGDAALLRMTEVLQSTFRQRDIIGRLGGDEFLAFIKDVTKRQILNQRMAELSQALSLSDGIPIAFSAGITFVQQKNFSYDRALRQADEALYYSKQHGKAQASYYADMVNS